MSAELTKIITNDNKTIKDLITEVIGVIYEDKLNAKLLTNRVTDVINRAGTEDVNITDVKDNLTVLGNIQTRFVELDQQSTKLLVEVLKTIAKLQEEGPGKEDSVGGGELEKLLKIAKEMNVEPDAQLNSIVHKLELSNEFLQ